MTDTPNRKIVSTPAAPATKPEAPAAATAPASTTSPANGGQRRVADFLDRLTFTDR